MSDKLVLITGATGHQGGATLRHMAKRGRIQDPGAHPQARLRRGLGARGVGCRGSGAVISTTPSRSRARWMVRGACTRCRVPGRPASRRKKCRASASPSSHATRTCSVSSTRRSPRRTEATGIPHFENKFRVEQSVKALGFPSHHAIVRPVFFMENLLSPWSLAGDKLTMGLSPNTKLQMIAADDIGKFGAKAFADADAMTNVEFDIGGDSVTMTEVAAALSPFMGTTLTYEQIPIDAVRKPERGRRAS